jgi:Rieske Fe-S protein
MYISMEPMNRRNIMKLTIGGIGVAVAAMAGIPSLVAGIAPLWTSAKKEALLQPLGPVDAVPVNGVREMIVKINQEFSGTSIHEKKVFVWRPSQEEIVVFSRSCTDLGCPLTYDPGSECYFCPCHGGIFNKNGERMAGPPERPMYRYTVLVKNGDIFIDLNSVPPVA